MWEEEVIRLPFPFVTQQIHGADPGENDVHTGTGVLQHIIPLPQPQTN